MEGIGVSRRRLLGVSGMILTSAIAHKLVFAAEQQGADQEQVSPPEDLMREHGVLRRILLIYRFFLDRLKLGGEIQWGKLDESASIIRSFVEDYHERLEEQYVFPAMYRAGKSGDVVNILTEQHQAGRKLTDIVSDVGRRQASEPSDSENVASAITQFVTMYEPHAAREDTVIFPQLHAVWQGKEYQRMGDVFEKEEDRVFGDQGFEKMVDRVSTIEKDLAIYDLRKFTPAI